MSTKRAFVGFDGYVDSLYRVVRSRQGEHKEVFPDIPAFAADLASRAGKSGGFELLPIETRAGGNAVLMAQGLGALGMEVSCAATVGSDVPEAVFQALEEKGCRFVTLGPPSRTLALEFDDGKFMLNDSSSFESLDWPRAQTIAGPALTRSIVSADLVALVDWANMPHSTQLWRGVLSIVKEAPSRERLFFFDLADITRRSTDEVKQALTLIAEFQMKGDCVLGLNENEARKLAAKFDMDPEMELERLTEFVGQAIGIRQIVIHPRDKAMVFKDSVVTPVPGRLVEKPVLSTGGGDHFNAGLCRGLLEGKDLVESSRLAMAVSGHYVSTGVSPTRDQLADLSIGK